jgi:hypothetical protein
MITYIFLGKAPSHRGKRSTISTKTGPNTQIQTIKKPKTYPVIPNRGLKGMKTDCNCHAGVQKMYAVVKEVLNINTRIST